MLWMERRPPLEQPPYLLATSLLGASQQALSMADAIAKISWRTAASGQVIVGAGTQGGICGTCFTLESGVTISCAHRTETLFKPNPGFDACRVYVLEWEEELQN